MKQRPFSAIELTHISNAADRIARIAHSKDLPLTYGDSQALHLTIGTRVLRRTITGRIETFAGFGQEDSIHPTELDAIVEQCETTKSRTVGFALRWHELGVLASHSGLTIDLMHAKYDYRYLGVRPSEPVEKVDILRANGDISRVAFNAEADQALSETLQIAPPDPLSPDELEQLLVREAELSMQLMNNPL